MTIVADAPADPLTEWLLHVRPVGLVIGPNILREEELVPPRQSAVDTEAVRVVLSEDVDDDASILPDPWAFFSSVLGWEARFVAGATGGPELPDSLTVNVPEHDLTLRPDWAVRELGAAGGYQLLVKLHLVADADQRGALADWEASPHQQFERLLREEGIPIGVLIDRTHLRVVYARSGETSGWISFPLRSLATVAGRPMLGGLKLMLGHARLFTEPEHRRLAKLLERSREAQNQVSTKLAEQVLGALHELLRALYAADPVRIEQLAATSPQHLYEGLLATLLRLVFLLYAEDRDLIPTVRSGEPMEIYEEGYSVRGLYARLVEDRALHPDTMDERVGGWGRLLALFRLVHGGHPSGWITPRGGKLFDPEAFPFLEGRDDGEPPSVAKVLPIRDGAILRILEGLMTIEARTLSGERVRERVSYRALDVEQIGSVYETVMGFKAKLAEGRSLAIRAGKKNRTPVFVDLDKLAAANGKDRIKLLKEEADRSQFSASVTKALEAARTTAELAAALDPVVDERGSPKKREIAKEIPILQPTDERRRTGSHYTPRSLTEPIVRHALEPVFERLGASATPEQILDLKVCDPAMGSGAFLVEACRALAIRLVEAWGRYPDKKPTIPADEDAELHAKRLVAQRCLYGVDKNPLATDLAKLSLWLATLARDHEFTFLDHALKSGDSLVGLTQAQIAAVHWDSSKEGLPLFRQLVKDRVAEAMKGRAEIQAAPDDTARVVQEQRHRSLEARLKDVRVMGDSVIAAFFADDKPKAREKKLAEVESWLTGSLEAAWDKLAAAAATLNQGAHPLRPFHWQIEFPEVFARENGGFDAVTGNPPFAGKNTVVDSNRPNYSVWLQAMHEGAHGNADQVAHFYRRSFYLLRQRGVFGLIATNTISQGDTRESGLTKILASGGSICRAIRRLEWPGEAQVIVSVVHVTKGAAPFSVLDGRRVNRISSFLVQGDMDESPKWLEMNAELSFEGSKIYGSGFTFDDQMNAKGETESLATMHRLIAHDPRNQQCIFPYIGGDEVNNSPLHAHHRYAIDFQDFPIKRDSTIPLWSSASDQQRARWLQDGIVPADYHQPVAADWPALLDIVFRLVKPERDKVKREARRKRWWRFGDRQPGLYEAIKHLTHVLAISRVTEHLCFARLATGMVYADRCAILPFQDFSSFCVVQSRVHETWARFFSSTMEDRLLYAHSDCFRTFVRPVAGDAALEYLGVEYHGHRAALMVARNEGMTKTYNRFHDRGETADDIARLRELHAAMDRAVLEAYGWHDLAVRAAPVFLDETNEDDHTYQGRLFWPAAFRDEVLAKLLALNAEQHAEEVRLGIAPGMKRKEDDGNEEDVEE
jgi:hypothetical protein